MTLIQQQRLLGAVLLVCLIGIIAWLLLDTVEQNQPAPPQEEPIVFDSVIEPIVEEDEVIEPVADVPEQAKEVVPSEPEAVAPTIDEPLVESSVTKPAPADHQQDSPETRPTEKPAKASAEPKWVLQLASFSVRKNADTLVAQLKEKGYTPMIETSDRGGKQIYRVRLKPVSDRSQLEQTARKLNAELKLNAQILQYQP